MASMLTHRCLGKGKGSLCPGRIAGASVTEGTSAACEWLAWLVHIGLAGGTWPGSTAGRPGTAMPAGLEGE